MKTDSTMLQGLRTVLYTVPDLDRAKAWYAEALGIEPYFDEPFYVGFDVGGYELGLTPEDGSAAADSVAAGPGGVVAYWGVEDADAALARLEAQGATVHEDVQDVGEGIRTAVAQDPFGNLLGVIENPHFQLPDAPSDAAP